MGQWSAYKKTLEPAPTKDESQAAKVKALKAELPKQGLPLARGYRQARELMDDIDEFKKLVQIELDAYEESVVAYLEGEMLDKATFPEGIGTLSMKDDIYTSVKDNVAWMQYLRDNNLTDLLSVHYGTMNSHVKALLDKGKPVPACLKAYFKQGIRWTKPRK